MVVNGKSKIKKDKPTPIAFSTIVIMLNCKLVKGQTTSTGTLLKLVTNVDLFIIPLTFNAV